MIMRLRHTRLILVPTVTAAGLTGRGGHRPKSTATTSSDSACSSGYRTGHSSPHLASTVWETELPDRFHPPFEIATASSSGIPLCPARLVDEILEPTGELLHDHRVG
jgi:hypothetical protein